MVGSLGFVDWEDYYKSTGTEGHLGGQRHCGLESPAVSGCWVVRVSTKGHCGKALGRAAGLQEVGLSAAGRTPALASDKWTLLVCYWKSLPGGRGQRGGKESARED